MPKLLDRAPDLLRDHRHPRVASIFPHLSDVSAAKIHIPLETVT